MKKIDLDLLFKLRFPGNLHLSPAGGKLGFTVSCADEEKNKYLTDLYLSDESGVRRMTASGGVRNFTFTDDSTVVFTDAREKKEKEEELPKTVFYTLPLQGGEAVCRFSVPLSVSSFEWIREGLWLLSASFADQHPDLHLESEEERRKTLKAEKEMAFRTVLKEIPFYANGTPEYTAGKREGLFLYREEDSRIFRLSNALLSVDMFRLSEDRKRLYFAAHQAKAKSGLFSALYFLEIPAEISPDRHDLSDEVQCLYPEEDFTFGDFWEAEPQEGRNPRVYVLATDMRRYGVNESFRLYELEPEKGALMERDAGEIRPYCSVGTDVNLRGGPSAAVCRGEYYFLTTDRYRTAIRRINRAGILETVYLANGAVQGIAAAENGLAICAMTDMKTPEIYSLTVEGLRQMSDLNESFMSAYHVAVPALIPAADENGIDGWALLPEAFDTSRKYPVILDIHGGPRTVYGEVFFHEMQYWAALGYVVLFCNPHGSDGRGDEFADIRGDYGGVDYEDIMSFLDRCLERMPNLDCDRIGVTGGSYGGFMCNWIVGHSDRFAACATQRSISNWLSFYGVSDIGSFFATDQNGTDTFGQAGFVKLWEHSPLRTVNAVKTPTLIIHSAEDYRCPLEQGLQWFTALKDRDVDCEMILFHGENHELSRSGKPKARRERLDRITRWMNRYLMPVQGESEAAHE